MLHLKDKQIPEVLHWLQTNFSEYFLTTEAPFKNANQFALGDVEPDLKNINFDEQSIFFFLDLIPDFIEGGNLEFGPVLGIMIWKTKNTFQLEFMSCWGDDYTFEIIEKNPQKFDELIERTCKRYVLDTSATNVDSYKLRQIEFELKFADEIEKLISSGEGQKTEFKQTFSLDVRTNKKEKYIELQSIKTIAAFLNSKGGTLLIGIDDHGERIGLESEVDMLHKGSTDKFLLHFKNVFKNFIGEDNYPYVEYSIDTKLKSCLVVSVLPSDRPVFVGKKDFYARTNPATDKLEGPELVEYIRRRFE